MHIALFHRRNTAPEHVASYITKMATLHENAPNSSKGDLLAKLLLILRPVSKCVALGNMAVRIKELFKFLV